MGMKIDEIIEEFEESKDYPTSDPASDEALNGAIDIMRRYQKIEELMRGWNNFNSYERMCDICEVIEDGNED